MRRLLGRHGRAFEEPVKSLLELFQGMRLLDQLMNAHALSPLLVLGAHVAGGNHDWNIWPGRPDVLCEVESRHARHG